MEVKADPGFTALVSELEAEYAESPSNFAFKVKLRRYLTGIQIHSYGHSTDVWHPNMEYVCPTSMVWRWRSTSD